MRAQLLPCPWLSSYQLRKDMQQGDKHGEITHLVVNSYCVWVRPHVSLLILIHSRFIPRASENLDVSVYSFIILIDLCCLEPTQLTIAHS